MRRFILFGAGGLVLAAAALMWWVYSSVQHVPEAYERMLAVDTAKHQLASTEMFNRSQRLANQAKRSGGWKATFAADEINGYLAVDPEGVLAAMLPATISDPRVVLGERTITMYCRYADGSVATVLSLEVEPFIGDERDVLGIRLREVRAGALSLPTGRVKEMLSEAAHGSDLPLRWVEEEGDPVALVTLPQTGNGRQVELATLEIGGGEIRLAGKSVR